ncbi:hypothetical protein FBR05_03385 [Deltaproteobacteria bacterium PRO3]|nr:hypothetical protein [Deltaproteobacteria bacterium PRO3]
MTRRFISVLSLLAILQISACSGQSGGAPGEDGGLTAAGGEGTQVALGDGVKAGEGGENPGAGSGNADPNTPGLQPANPSNPTVTFTPGGLGLAQPSLQVSPNLLAGINVDSVLTIPYWLCQAHSNQRWSGPKDADTIYLSESVQYCAVSLPPGAKIKGVDLYFYPLDSNSNFADLNSEQGVWSAFAMQALSTATGAQWRSIVKGARLSVTGSAYKIEEIPGCSVEAVYSLESQEKPRAMTCETVVPPNGQVFFRVENRIKTKDENFLKSFPPSWTGVLPPPTFAVMAVKYSLK